MAMTKQANSFERTARAQKVQQIVRAMDRAIRAHGAEPDSDPSAVASVLSKWPATDWARFAVANGIRPPSPTTVGLVLADYRARGERLIVTTGEELSEAS